MNGQESNSTVVETIEGISSTSFNWKPFTIELNSSNVGHGISIEKNFKKNMAFRIGVASDLKPDEYTPRDYKINFGVMYNVLNYRFLSLRMGIDLGMRKVSNGLNYFEYCFMGPIEPITYGFIDIPLLLQTQITEKLSLELGIRTMFQKPTEFSEMITTGRVDSPTFHYGQLDKRLHNYHIGLRYTFTE